MEKYYPGSISVCMQRVMTYLGLKITRKKISSPEKVLIIKETSYSSITMDFCVGASLLGQNIMIDVCVYNSRVGPLSKKGFLWSRFRTRQVRKDCMNSYVEEGRRTDSCLLHLSLL